MRHGGVSHQVLPAKWNNIDGYQVVSDEAIARLEAKIERLQQEQSVRARESGMILAQLRSQAEADARLSARTEEQRSASDNLATDVRVVRVRFAILLAILAVLGTAVAHGLAAYFAHRYSDLQADQ